VVFWRRRFTTFSASSELPMSVEDSMLFWLSKCSLSLQKRVGNAVLDKQLTDLKQLSDGCFLASTISFYAATDLPFNGISLQYCLTNYMSWEVLLLTVYTHHHAILLQQFVVYCCMNCLAVVFCMLCCNCKSPAGCHTQ